MSMDDQQWQHQEEQRLAHERAQQAETERQARVQEELLEQERLDQEHQERQEREEQDRQVRQNAHATLLDDDTAMHAERSPLKSIWNILFGKRASTKDSPFPTQAPLDGVQQDKRSRASSLVLLAVCAAVIGVGLWLYQSRKADSTLSVAEPSLVGVAPTLPDVEPGQAGLSLPAIEASPRSEADETISSAEALPALAPLPADESAVEETGTASPITATPEADAGVPALASDMPTEVPLVLDVPTPTMEQRIGQLETEVEQLRQMLAQRPAPVQARAAPKRTPARKAAPVKKAAPKYNPRLLSVDLWDGKPSVVVATDEPGDTRTRVLQPGDTLNGITLRAASVAERSALFDVGDGKLVRLGVESQ